MRSASSPAVARQAYRPPRVSRVTFIPYTRPFLIVLGFTFAPFAMPGTPKKVATGWNAVAIEHFTARCGRRRWVSSKNGERRRCEVEQGREGPGLGGAEGIPMHVGNVGRDFYHKLGHGKQSLSGNET